MHSRTGRVFARLHYHFAHARLLRDRVRKCVLYAAMACMVRPTNAIIWMLVFSSVIYRLVPLRRPIALFFAEIITIG
jgi:phosphatidylinositol glycan class B